MLEQYNVVAIGNNVASPRMMRHIRELCPKAGGKFKRPSQRSARNNEENGNEVRDMCLDS